MPMFMLWMWACTGRRYCCRELRYSLCISKIDRSISKRVILRRIKTTRARRCHPQDVCLSNKPLSQSCAGNKIIFYRAVQTAGRTTKASKVWFSYSHNCTLDNGAVFCSVCPVRLSSGPPEFFTFRYCA